MRVIDIPKQYQFISDSQDVESVASYFGLSAKDYDSFFVWTSDGDYVGVYGMQGIIPFDNKSVDKVL